MFSYNVLTPGLIVTSLVVTWTFWSNILNLTFKVANYNITNILRQRFNYFRLHVPFVNSNLYLILTRHWLCQSLTKMRDSTSEFNTFAPRIGAARTWVYGSYPVGQPATSQRINRSRIWFPPSQTAPYRHQGCLMRWILRRNSSSDIPVSRPYLDQNIEIFHL